MKKTIIISLALVIAGVAGWYFFLKEPSYKATNGYLVNLNKDGVIIEGYDPVAYFTDQQPVKGSSAFSTEFEGATYWFASTAHKAMFEKEPKKYAPQYGAFCGYAVSIGKLRPVDPTIYQIEEGRLILQHTQQAYNLFNKDLKANTAKADKNWPELINRRVGQPVEFDKPAPAPTASSD